MISPDKPLRVVFAGTPLFAAHHLQSLIDHITTGNTVNLELVGVYTQPDRPAGRGKKLTPSPVKQLAEQHDLPVFQPLSLKEDADQKTLAELKPDIMIVVAYGLLLPKQVLTIPAYGCINVHGSLLPRWRGAAPIQRAVAAGDEKTGITIMQMDVGLDTGDMLLNVDYPMKPKETSASLHDELMALGPPALLNTLALLRDDKLVPEAQDDTLATYAAKLSKEEAAIEWGKPAELIERMIRAYNPFPIAYSHLADTRIKIYEANIVKGTDTRNINAGNIIAIDDQGIMVSCGEGAINLMVVQLPGKKPMPVSDLLNGYSDFFAVGSRFGE